MKEEGVFAVKMPNTHVTMHHDAQYCASTQPSSVGSHRMNKIALRHLELELCPVTYASIAV